MQIFGTNIVSVDVKEELDSLWWEKHSVPKPIEFTTDPVALSCAAWRQRYTDPYPDLALMTPSEADHAMAQNIRNHYVAKITMQKLRSDRISQFREKLGAFLVGNRSLVKEELGMLYHLPYFYQEDLAFASTIQKTCSANEEFLGNAIVELKPLNTIETRRRSGVATQFWWTDTHNRPYCVSVVHSSEHSTLIRSLWEFSNIAVNARVHRRASYGTDKFYYYKIGNMKLLGVTP